MPSVDLRAPTASFLASATVAPFAPLQVPCKEGSSSREVTSAAFHVTRTLPHSPRSAWPAALGGTVANLNAVCTAASPWQAPATHQSPSSSSSSSSSSSLETLQVVEWPTPAPSTVVWSAFVVLSSQDVVSKKNSAPGFPTTQISPSFSCSSSGCLELASTSRSPNCPRRTV